jgi:cytochrome c553
MMPIAPHLTRSFLTLLLAGLLCAAGGARAQAVAVPPKAETCAACHGVGGKSVVSAFPVLAGQSARYLYLQMRDFQEGRRKNELMTPQMAGLTRDEMRALADYFAAQKPAQQPFKPDPEKARLGKAKADETLCTMCHLGEFKGQNEIPRVSGQHYDYIVKQLSDFKARRRTNDAGNMTSVSNTLNEADIENLAHYIAGL